MWTLVSFAALVIVLFLGWNLYRRFGADRISSLNDRRRASSRLVSRGEYVDGSRRLAVALAVTPSTFFYENADMQASVDLHWVQEIEYDTELATGLAAPGGTVLRLRAHSQTFEFVLPEDVVGSWKTMLPARQSSKMEEAETAPGPVHRPEAAGTV
jgi:hypothetical protein